MSVLFEAMWYSSIYYEQEYTGFTETENRVLFTSLVRQEYTGYTATENLVELFMSLVKQEYTGYTATQNLVALCINKNSCIMPVSFEEWGIPASVLSRSTQGT